LPGWADNLAQPRDGRWRRPSRATATILGAVVLGPSCFAPGSDHEGLTECSEDNVDTYSDPRHCGSCFHSCEDQTLSGESDW
jgi:hypothetical protein